LKKFKILIDAAGTATAISIIKGIQKQKKYKVDIITIDMNDLNAGRFLSNKFYKVPPATSSQFIEVILNICRKEKVDLFVPIIDLSFLELAKNAKKFENLGTLLLLASLKTIEITSDKKKTFEFFKKENIPTPQIFSLNNGLKYPLFIKPRIGGRASINAFKVKNERDLEFYLSKIPDPLLQEYIEGEEFTADCLNSLDGSVFIDCVIRKRLETKSGLSIKAEVLSFSLSQEIKKYVKIFSEKLRIPGAYNVQGFIKKDGRILFTEINPRFAGTHAFTIEAGLNSIEYILDMMNGRSPEEIKQEISINYNLKMVRYWEEIFIDRNKVYNPWMFWK